MFTSKTTAAVLTVMPFCILVTVAHAKPTKLSDRQLEAIWAGDGSGSGNGNGNIGNGNGNGNIGNGNGNGNVGDGFGNGNSGSYQGNGPAGQASLGVDPTSATARGVTGLSVDGLAGSPHLGMRGSSNTEDPAGARSWSGLPHFHFNGQTGIDLHAFHHGSGGPWLGGPSAPGMMMPPR
jgi:hypothetical protein